MEKFHVVTAKGHYEIEAADASRASQKAPGKTQYVENVATGERTGPKVIGYERVPGAGDCAYCSEAAHKIYHSHDLMPIHEHCKCGTAPVFKGEKDFHPPLGDAVGKQFEVEVTGWDADGEAISWSGRGLSEEDAIANAKADGGIVEVGDSHIVKVSDIKPAVKDNELGARLTTDHPLPDSAEHVHAPVKEIKAPAPTEELKLVKSKAMFVVGEPGEYAEGVKAGTKLLTKKEAQAQIEKEGGTLHNVALKKGTELAKDAEGNITTKSDIASQAVETRVSHMAGGLDDLSKEGWKNAEGKLVNPPTAAEIQAKAETTAVRAYITSSGDINNILRGTNVDTIGAKAAKKAKAQIDALDSVFKNAKLSKDRTVLRGVVEPRDLFGVSTPEELVGTEFVDAGFMSTTTSWEVADNFASYEGGEQAILRIKVPKGFKAVKFAETGEDEILLNRNTKLRIINASEKKGVWKIDAEVVVEDAVDPDFAKFGIDPADPYAAGKLQMAKAQETMDSGITVMSGGNAESLQKNLAIPSKLSDLKSRLADAEAEVDDLLKRNLSQPGDMNRLHKLHATKAKLNGEINKLTSTTKDVVKEAKAVDTSTANKFLDGVTDVSDATQGLKGMDAEEALLEDSKGVKLSNAESAADIAYADDAWTINSYLREGKEVTGIFNPATDREIKNYTDVLDKAIARTTIKNKVTVYRGIGDPAEMLGTDWESSVGKTFVDEGYVSTTTSDGIADTFARDGGTRIEITVNEGEHGLYQPGVANANDTGELELILPRGQHFTVTEIDTTGTNPIIRVEMNHTAGPAPAPTPVKVIETKSAPGTTDHKVVTTEFSEWGAARTEAQVQAYADYAGSDSYHINAALRGFSDMSPEDRVLAKNLDSSMKTLDQDIFVMRGSSSSFKEMFGRDPKVGGKVTDKGFVSTSTDAQIAEHFTSGEGEGAIFRIHAPAGTRGGWLDSALNGGADLIEGVGEQELVLARGSTFEITAIGEDGVIEMRVVHQQATKMVSEKSASKVDTAEFDKANAEIKELKAQLEDAGHETEVTMNAEYSLQKYRHFGMDAEVVKTWTFMAKDGPKEMSLLRWWKP